MMPCELCERPVAKGSRLCLVHESERLDHCCGVLTCLEIVRRLTDERDRLRLALARIEAQEETDRPWTSPRIIAREALELCGDAAKGESK